MIRVYPKNIFPAKPIFSLSGKGNNDQDERITKTLKWSIEYNEKIQVYHMTIGPIYDFLRVLGMAPFYRDSTGKMEYKFYSGIMLYSVVIYVLIASSAVLSIIDISSQKKTTFNGQVDNVMTSCMIAPQIITPILSWMQMKSHQEYLNDWVAFQEKYEQVTRTGFPRLKYKTPKTIIHTGAMILMIVLILPHYLSDLQWHHYPGYLFNVAAILLHFMYWRMTSAMISKVSNKFQISFQKEIARSKSYTAQIENYRLLWMMLSKLIRKCGSSSSYMVSIFILTNMVYLVCVIYNTGFDCLEYYKMMNFHSIFGAVLVTVFWWIILMLYCEAGYKMTESSMQGLLHSILEIKNCNVLSHEDELHVNIFLYTLKQYSSDATVSDYFVVNRSLFGSIVTALITYIIVVIQFHVNNYSV